jgi:RES domain-containing protein
MAEGSRGLSQPLAFSGPVWRILPRAAAAHPGLPAAAPEGRFHHSGQVAAYASLSAEGAAVAIKRYLVDGIERVLVPMWLDAPSVVDIRGDAAASIIWQDLRKGGSPSPTWTYSDAARESGAQAMLYSSRSRPDLSHVVVFEPECLRFVGPVSAFCL